MKTESILYVEIRNIMLLRCDQMPDLTEDVGGDGVCRSFPCGGKGGRHGRVQVSSATGENY